MGRRGGRGQRCLARGFQVAELCECGHEVAGLRCRRGLGGEIVQVGLALRRRLHRLLEDGRHFLEPRLERGGVGGRRRGRRDSAAGKDLFAERFDAVEVPQSPSDVAGLVRRNGLGGELVQLTLAVRRLFRPPPA